MIIIIGLIALFITIGIIAYYKRNSIIKWLRKDSNKKKLAIGGAVLAALSGMFVAAYYNPPIGPLDFSSTENLGYEVSDGILHVWNERDDYFFNVSNGLQFSNNNSNIWTKSVMMIGYYDGDNWNLIYRTDELSGFNNNIEGVTDTYLNLTLWKDLSYNSYDFRLGLRYYIENDDYTLTVIPFITALGNDIPFEIGFGWELNNIRIGGHQVNNNLSISNQKYDFDLSDDLDITYDRSDIEEHQFMIYEYDVENQMKNRFIRLSWNGSLDYKVKAKSRIGQYNCPVTWFVKTGGLVDGQTKSTKIYWHDSDTSFTEYLDEFIYSYQTIQYEGTAFGIPEGTHARHRNDLFWRYLHSNAKWQLQAWHPIQEVWVSEYGGENLNNWMSIDRNRSDDNYNEKFTLNITNNAGVNTYFRFVLLIDLNVLSHVDKTDDNEYILRYNFGDRVINISYNWSDIIPLIQDGTISINKGFINIKDEKTFYFIIEGLKKLPDGEHFELDPNFGNEDDSGTSYKVVSNQMYAGKYKITEYGKPQKIIVELRPSGSTAEEEEAKCALFDSNGNFICGTEEKLIGYTGAYVWYEFDIVNVTPVPVLMKDNYYYITVWGDNYFSVNMIGEATSFTNECFYYSSSYGDWPDSVSFSTDPGENLSIYCQYEVANMSFDYESPSNNSINVSLNGIINVTVNNYKGNSMTCDFYTSTDEISWIHRQTNTSVLNESISYNGNGIFNKLDETYYWKVTANDTETNESIVFNFENTPYEANQFLDTFNSENWVDETNELTFNSSEDRYEYTSSIAAPEGITAIEPIEISPGSLGSWQTVDCTTYGVPTGAEGIIVEVYSVSYSEYQFGIQHPDSTDDFTAVQEDRAHQWFACGINDAAEVEIYLQSSEINVMLTGYVPDGAGEFVANAIDHSTSTTGSFQDVDISGDFSGGTPKIALGYMEVKGTSSSYFYSLRENGYSYDFYTYIYGNDICGYMVPCDSNSIFEQKIQNTYIDCYVTGCIYANSCESFDEQDESLGTTGSYETIDMSAYVPESATGVFFAAYDGNSEYKSNPRNPDYSSYDKYTYSDVSELRYGWVSCNSSEIELKIENTNSDFAILGYTYGGTISADGNITSVNITKPADSYWDKILIDSNISTNQTYSILDPSNGYVILSDLSNGDSISSITNTTIRIYGEFNLSLYLNSWRVTWNVSSEFCNDFRTDGEDYVIWYGDNVSLSVACQEYEEDSPMTWSSGEYIAIWKQGATWDGDWAIDGAWYQYHPHNSSGHDETVHTYDVIKSYILDDVGNHRLCIETNDNITYSSSRTIILSYSTNNYGGNFTGYTPLADTTIGDINSSNISGGLEAGNYINVWSKLSYTWLEFFIVGFNEPIIAVEQGDIIFTRVTNTETWTMDGM